MGNQQNFISPIIFCVMTIAACSHAHALIIPAQSRDVPAGKTNVPVPEVEWIYSPNFDLRSYTTVDVDAIVIHTTEVNYQGTLNIFENPESAVSAHFVIAPDGHIVQMVDTAYKAWHATYYNSRSVGIEMVGYSYSQSTWNENNLNALMDLLAWIATSYDIPIEHPLGDAYDYPGDTYDAPGLVAHGQVQPWNRSDPGPYFPWQEVLTGTQQRIDAAAPEPATLTLLVSAIGLCLGSRRSRGV